MVMESNSCPGLCAPQDRLRVNIDGNIFLVDKNLLDDHCEYFRALFRSGMRECQQGEIHLQSVGVLGFLVMLQVLYGDQPILNSDQIVEAIECTAFLHVPALSKHLNNIIDSDNCVLMYHTAATYGAWEIYHHSALFIRDMYSDLQSAVQTLPKQLVEHIESLSPSSYMAMCSHSPSSELLPDSQRTICYLDEEDKEWKVYTHLPANISTTMAGVAVLDNKLYIIGGVHDVSKKVAETGFCYDPMSNTWTTFCGPQRPRYNFSLIGLKGCLYAVGGEYELNALSSMERYSVSNESWRFVSHLPCPVASVAFAVAMSRIFICLWKGQGASDIYEYVPEKDQWILVTTLIRDRSYALCMVAHKDNLYVMRNGPCGDFLLCAMDCYNLSLKQWTAMLGQYGNSKGSLFTAAVRGDSVFTLSRKVTTEYTIEANRWRTKCEMRGFGRIGSIYTFLMRLPKATISPTGRHPSLSQCQNVEVVADGPKYPMRCSENL
ncbi:kelch repeat and BTB domain-containing protein 13 [Thalassophryne amazonica]|uniref:kelch repeat and BTB domain-containing protein 13 n=1 Tax=Thalassophryne amazonica TaxID=390379 RepID=UPI00147139D0|nr:kelch repeat and BTB domain-containing protein 13 [Thalassophryne amazonica]